MPDVVVVTDPQVVRLLTDPSVRRFLGPFMAGPSETAAAARTLGVSTKAMAHRVARFRRAGLVEPVAERRHAGRPVTTWAAASSFRCPLSELPDGHVRTAFELMDQPGRDAFLDALVRAAHRGRVLDWDLRIHHETDGVHVSVSPSGSSWLPGDPHPTAPPVVLSWLPVALTTAQAVALQDQLLALARDLPLEPSAPTYLCGIFLTPL